MQIDGNTHLVGLIAHPVSHVRTPQFFNASAAKQGLNAVCVPFHVKPPQLKAWLNGVSTLQNLRGLIVTIPHKEAVAAACHKLTDAAHLIGSVNAMRFDHAKGWWVGANFDGDGFIAGLQDRGHSLVGKHVLQIGAGGAGKAMAHAIAAERPAEFVVFNRSPDRAAELVDTLTSAFPTTPIRMGDDNPEGFDVVVNATSLGLRDTDALLLSQDGLRPGMLVCEAVIRDGDTPPAQGGERTRLRYPSRTMDVVRADRKNRSFSGYSSGPRVRRSYSWTTRLVVSWRINLRRLELMPPKRRGVTGHGCVEVV